MTVEVEPIQAWGALVIFGLPDPLSPLEGPGVVFTNGPFLAPAEIPAATFMQRGWLKDLGGETFTANLRDPCAAGGGIRAVVDDFEGALSALFSRDSAMPRWYLETASLDATETSLTLTGDTAPIPDRHLWVEGEAMLITNTVAGSSPRTWVVDVQRGMMGSVAVSHAVRPSLYWVPDSDDLTARMEATPTPQPTRHRFFARAYRLRETTAGAEVSHYRDLYLSGIAARVDDAFELSFEPVAKLLEEHEVRKGASPVSLSRCIEILSTKEIFGTGGKRLIPDAIALYLTAKECALWLDFPLRRPGEEGIDTGLLTAASVRAVSTPEVPRYVHLDTSAGKGTYEITALNKVFGLVWDPQTELVRVLCEHRKSDLDLTGKQLSLLPGLAADIVFPLDVYEGGFATDGGVPIPGGQEPPTVELWLLPTLTVASFFATALGSNMGGGDGAFDVFPPGFGIGLRDDFIHWGVSAVTPSLDTLDLAELDQLLTRKWLLPLKPGTKLSDILNSLCRLLRLVVTPLATGGLTLRTWARPIGGVVSDVIFEQGDLSFITDIEPLRALEFVAGVDLLTFEPLTKTPRFATVQGTLTPERGDTQRVWVFSQTPQALSDAAFASGDVFECCRAFFITLQGTPLVLRGVTDLDVSAYETVDYVTLTDDAVPTPLGRGVVSKRYIVISIGLSWNDSGQPLLLLPDELNNEDLQSVGKIAPTLILRELRDVTGAGPYTARVRVDSIGESSFDASTAHGGIWDAIRLAGGYVRIQRPIHATVTSPTLDQKGWLEAYAVLKTSSYIGPESELTIELAAAFLHDGLTVADYLAPGESFLTLMDVDSTNRLGFRVEPIPAQLYDDGAGEDFAKFDGLLPFDSHRTVIGP